MRYAAVTALVLAACSHPAPQQRAAPPPPGDDRFHNNVVVMISANAEWKIIRELLHGETTSDTPFGEWMFQHLGGHDGQSVVFFHGG